MKRIFGAGEGPDLVDLTATFPLVIKGTGLFKHPDVMGLVVSTELLEPLFPHSSRYSLKILFLQQQACARGVAAKTALLTAEPFPEEPHTLVGVRTLIAGRQGQRDVEWDLFSLIYAAMLFLPFQDGPVGTQVEQKLMASLALLFHAGGKA
jgi:hypothetical protein